MKMIKQLLPCSCLFLFACEMTPSTHKSNPGIDKGPVSSSFIEESTLFPTPNKNRRKWDAPLIADLDQDGWMDIVLNDHGYSIQILWNDQGHFREPYDLVMGDMHGVSVADYDKDERQELIISPGGGSGSNARNSRIYEINQYRQFKRETEFSTPLALMRGRTVKFFDGDNDGHLDLINFAYPSQEKKGKSENYIYRNNTKGELLLHSTLPRSYKDGQKTLISDFNNDNIVDLLLYGHGKVRTFLGDGQLGYKDVSQQRLPHDITNVTAVVELDYDNDGDFDLFLSRGKEFVAGETFYDKRNQTWAFFSKRGKFHFDHLKVGEVLNIENYQSQWPNKKAYIGESAYLFPFQGETHSGKNMRLVSSDALGWPDTPDKKGMHVGYIGNQEWRLAGDTFSPITAVLHSVKDYPVQEIQPGPRDLLLENRGQHFVDVTEQAGLTHHEHTNGIAVADIDNNGFDDLVIIPRGNLVSANKALLYLNSGKGKFHKQEQHGLISKELGAIGLAAEPFDYNNDGQVDILIGNERGLWHLFKNTHPEAANNRALTIWVLNSEKHFASALGALVSIEACGNTQIKRVGSGAANYSRSFNQLVHFGLNKCDQVANISIRWPNGENAYLTANQDDKIVIAGKLDQEPQL